MLLDNNVETYVEAIVSKLEKRVKKLEAKVKDLNDALLALSKLNTNK